MDSIIKWSIMTDSFAALLLRFPFPKFLLTFFRFKERNDVR